MIVTIFALKTYNCLVVDNDPNFYSILYTGHQRVTFKERYFKRFLIRKFKKTYLFDDFLELSKVPKFSVFLVSCMNHFGYVVNIVPLSHHSCSFIWKFWANVTHSLTYRPLLRLAVDITVRIIGWFWHIM